MKSSLARFVLCGVMAMVISDCEAKEMDMTVAERCVLVNAIQERGRELIPVLDAFADDEGLMVEKSHPLNPRYLLRNEEAVVGEISYRFGMGRFGAELSLFRYIEGFGQELAEKFDVVISKFEELGFSVTPCDDVEGDQKPSTYQ